MSVDGLHRRIYRRLLSAAGARATGRRTIEVAYVLPVGERVQNAVSRMQVRLLDACGTEPHLPETPHITLKLSFKSAVLEPLGAHLDLLCREVEPFGIRIGDVGFFDEGVMFLDVEANPALEALRQRVLRDLSSGYGVQPYDIEGPRFHFHVTIAYGLSRQDLARARCAFTAPTGAFEFVPERMALLCHTGTQWFTYRRARFGERAGREDENERAS